MLQNTLRIGKPTEFKHWRISEKHIAKLQFYGRIQKTIFIMMLVDIIVGGVCFGS